MARIIGGIAASHTPTIGFAYDRNKRDDPVWAPIFENFAPLAAWLAEKRPDVLLLIYNDHVTSFFFDHYSAFALGVGPEWPVADEGGGARDLPPIKGHPQLAVAHRALADGRRVRHVVLPAPGAGPRLLLAAVGALPARARLAGADRAAADGRAAVPDSRPRAASTSSARRCGARSRAIPRICGVAIVATGGLSHQVHGERAGFNNPDWDNRFLDLFERDPEQLAAMTIAEYAELGGFEGAEVVMWLTMRGALSANVECKHRSYYLPSMTGIATAIYEGMDARRTRPSSSATRRHVASELERHREARRARTRSRSSAA